MSHSSSNYRHSHHGNHLVNATPNESKVRTLCASGYREYDQQRYSEALRLFYQAWLELPKPQSSWPESTWVLSSIGDCYFRLQQFEQGCESLTSALHCPAGQQSPFIQLRLGECQHELKQPILACKHLRKAYDMGGNNIFNGQDQKYLRAAKLNSHE
jgi:tetratricopeptide (TPR) repeat protein|tara:strand:+ start:1436 stop:1906 length:471 start_codon:yes stop_codon:yes gene_type:complete